MNHDRAANITENAYDNLAKQQQATTTIKSKDHATYIYTPAEHI